MSYKDLTWTNNNDYNHFITHKKLSFNWTIAFDVADSICQWLSLSLVKVVISI